MSNFVVPRNGQALLGLPETDVLKLINIIIDSIDTEVTEIRSVIQT